MLTKWTVENFKSIVNETTLDLKPLTIFAGANSSGKSSFLQSILLISQTLSNQVSRLPVVLNGSFVRLGCFDDLRSYGGKSDQITLGWECTYFANFSKILFQRQPLRHRLPKITCRISFDTDLKSKDREIYQFQPKMSSFFMSISSSSLNRKNQCYEFKAVRVKKLKDKLNKLSQYGLDDDIDSNKLEYNISFDKKSLREIREKHSTAKPIGCDFKHFLPEKHLLLIDSAKEISQHIFAQLCGEIRYSTMNYFQHQYPKKFQFPKEMIDELIKKSKTQINVSKNTVNFLKGFLQNPGRSIYNFHKELFFTLTRKETSDFIQMCKKWTELPIIIENSVKQAIENEQTTYNFTWISDTRDTELASRSIYRFFTENVKYLGPLRDEPKPLYPISASTDPSDIGIRGEMTAAVLNIYRDEKIKYIPSRLFGKNPFSQEIETTSLQKAVADWMQYLDVAETAQTEDMGKIGHALKVSLPGGSPLHDLTHVGVGVSQVLPILVMTLLAKPDTTFIFEQPELHLHPKVQTRLADFFLSIILSGKQCLIETHSEYIINRLRLRAALEEESSLVTDNLKIYFVEKNDGASAFRDVVVNEYGAIMDWPEGFFDQGQDEIEALILAAATKRKRQRGK